MNREKIETKNENFIGCWNIDNPNLCLSIIEFFENNPQLHVKGSVTSGDKNAKKTTDLTIFPNDLKKENFSIFKEYFNQLYNCYADYQLQWPFLKEHFSTLDISSFNVQKYNPGDHFSVIHCERDSVNMHRVFAWMTYLNDIKAENGATYYSHYDVKIKPEKGKTLIWPAEWTHAHKGEVLNKGNKYIITGWMHFPFTFKL